MAIAVDKPFLDTTAGEAAFFRAVAHARPAGAHRYFHMITARSMIRAETGQELAISELWTKLGQYFNLQYFDSNVRPKTLPRASFQSQHVDCV